MKIAIVGSRTFKDYKLLKDQVMHYLDLYSHNFEYFISGGAVGVDSMVQILAKEVGCCIKIYYPDWSIGKSAGIKRNRKIIDNADVVIAFWDGKSRGTKNSIELAKSMNKVLFIVHYLDPAHV